MVLVRDVGGGGAGAAVAAAATQAAQKAPSLWQQLAQRTQGAGQALSGKIAGLGQELNAIGERAGGWTTALPLSALFGGTIAARQMQPELPFGTPGLVPMTPGLPATTSPSPAVPYTPGQPSPMAPPGVPQPSPSGTGYGGDNLPVHSGTVDVLGVERNVTPAVGGGAPPGGPGSPFGGGGSSTWGPEMEGGQGHGRPVPGGFIRNGEEELPVDPITGQPIASPAMGEPVMGDAGQPYDPWAGLVGSAQLNLQDPLAPLFQMQQQSLEMRDQLSGMFAEATEFLSQQYNLAETPQERALVTFALQDLNRQYEMATAGVAQAYGQGASQFSGIAQEAMKHGPEDVKQVADLYGQAMAEAIGGMADGGAWAGQQGLGVGATNLSADARDMMGVMGVEGGAESLYAQEHNDILTRDLARGQMSMFEQLIAQQGGLAADMTNQSSGLIGQHMRSVSDRINNERLHQAGAMGNLQGQFLGQDFGLQHAYLDAYPHMTGAIEGLNNVQSQDWLAQRDMVRNLQSDAIYENFKKTGQWALPNGQGQTMVNAGDLQAAAVGDAMGQAYQRIAAMSSKIDPETGQPIPLGEAEQALVDQAGAITQKMQAWAIEIQPGENHHTAWAEFFETLDPQLASLFMAKTGLTPQALAALTKPAALGAAQLPTPQGGSTFDALVPGAPTTGGGQQQAQAQAFPGQYQDRGTGGARQLQAVAQALPQKAQPLIPMIEQVSGEVGVNPKLLAALVWAESNFDPQATSGAGAQGLGQLMPGTARGLGVSDPFDPRQNLRGAATYLKQQIEKFGSIELGLAAYNAGPGNVSKYGGIPPFTETQNYVPKVLGYYQKMIGGGGGMQAPAPSGGSSVFAPMVAPPAQQLRPSQDQMAAARSAGLR